MALFALVLALFLQAQPAAPDTGPATTDPATLLGAPAEKARRGSPKIGDKLAEAPPAAGEPAPAEEDRFPAGAPHDDYQFVAWCYGNLRAYLDLHDQVMPEVTRIESTFRPPNRKLSDDLKVYADACKKEGPRAAEEQFQAALTAAEEGEPQADQHRPGAAAVSKGADVRGGSPRTSRPRASPRPG